MFGQAAAWRTALEIPREDASAYTSAMQARWSRHGLAPPPETWGRGWMESACKHSSPTSLNNGIGGGGVISGDLHLWFHVPPFFMWKTYMDLGTSHSLGAFWDPCWRPFTTPRGSFYVLCGFRTLGTYWDFLASRHPVP